MFNQSSNTRDTSNTKDTSDISNTRNTGNTRNKRNTRQIQFLLTLFKKPVIPPPFVANI